MTIENGAEIASNDPGVDSGTGAVDNGQNASIESGQVEVGSTSGKPAIGAAQPKPDQNVAPTDTPAAYTPNFKFKSKGNEWEIPEKYRPLVTDATSEKELRDIFEKFHGFDIVKQDRQTIRQERDHLKEQTETTERGLNVLSGFIQKKDFDSFFEAFGIPPEDVIRYAVNVAQRTPEQQAALAADRQRQTQIKEYDDGYRQLQAQNQDLSVQMREVQLSSAMSKPDYASVIEAYNAGQDNPDAFREFVIRIGQAYAAQNQDISAEQAVQEATRHLSAVMPRPGVVGQPQNNPNRVVTPSTKPTLPNIAGSGRSPVKSQVKNLDDLRRIRAERF